MEQKVPETGRLLQNWLQAPKDLHVHSLLPGEEEQFRGKEHSTQVRVPEQIGHYRVFEELGAGGNARVYLCEDLRLHRPVALKILQSTDPRHVARFTREAQVAAGLDHPNIVKVFESGERQGRAYIAMQYVKGRTLHGAPLGVEEALKAIRKIALAIHYAHSREILHRDVKPSNILLDDSGEVFLTDFGLGRETHSGTLSATGAVLGTPSYMSPEQAKGEAKSVGPLSDVYSLGATLYELVTGTPPFEGTTAFDVLEKVSKGWLTPPRQRNPKLPRDVEVIILKAMAPEPLRRYSSAEALADDIGRFLSGEPIHATPPSLTQSLRRIVRKHSILATLATGLLIGGLGILLPLQPWSTTSATTATPLREHCIFRDSMAKGWENWSWSSKVLFDHTDHIHSGTHAIHLNVTKPWGALQVAIDRDEKTISFNDYDAVEFQVHGGTTGRTIYVQLYGSRENDTPIVELVNAGSVRAGAWQFMRVPMKVLNPQNLPACRMAIVSDKTGDLYLDEIRLVTP